MGLFTLCTMKLSQGPVKYVIGCWTRHWTTSVYTKEKMSKWPWSLRFSKDVFKGPHYPLTWSNEFCSGRSKRGALIVKGKGAWQRNVDIIIFLGGICFGGKRRWRQEKTREWSNLISSLKIAFLGHILKISTHSLFGAWSFLLVHIWFTPSEGPKSFVNWSFKKPNHGS
jgi:hypothetical protein